MTQVDVEVTEETTADAPVAFKPKFTLSKDFSSDIPKSLKTKFTISLPQANYTHCKEAVERHQLRRIDPTIERKGDEWADAIFASVEHLTSGGIYSEAVERDNSAWAQSITDETTGRTIGLRFPKFASGNKQLVGEEALLHIQSLMGQGKTIQIPLVNSGFWVSLKAPDQLASALLSEEIISAKSELGYLTHGRIFSNEGVLTTKLFKEFIRKFIYSHNLKGVDDEALWDHIEQEDYMVLIGGLAAAKWADGFKYSVPCIHDCKGISIEKLLSVQRLLFFDVNALTPKQRAHMTKVDERHPNNLVTLDEIKEYKAQFAWQSDAVRSVANENFRFQFESPSINKAIQFGELWISMLKGSYEDTLTRYNPDQRTEYLLKLSQQTTLCQYAHFVKEVEILDNDGAVIQTHSEPNMIMSIMKLASGDEQLVTDMFTVIRDLLNRKVIALFAVPNFSCPECHKPQIIHDDEDNSQKAKEINPHLIPLDTQHIFFELNHLYLQEMLSRRLV